MKGRITIIVTTIFLATIFASAWWLKSNPASYWHLYVNFFAKDCSYPDGNPCSETQSCVLLEPTRSICLSKDLNPTPEITFPITSGSRTICTQGPRSAKGRTHSYWNALFAVDLATPEQESNAKIISAFDGVAITSEGCDNQDDSKFNNDRCGNGFGNWVVIFDSESDLLTLSAHLRNVYIQDGETVKKGQIIGEEGKTGAAGHRHLHFSVHRNIWKLTPELVNKYGFWLPPSIPFRTKIKDSDGRESTVHVKDLPCEDNSDLTRSTFQGHFPEEE